MAGKAMSATQQEVDRRWREAVEAAKAEILAGLTLSEYIRRTGTEDDLDEWSELLAQFGVICAERATVPDRNTGEERAISLDRITKAERANPADRNKPSERARTLNRSKFPERAIEDDRNVNDERAISKDRNWILERQH